MMLRRCRYVVLASLVLSTFVSCGDDDSTIVDGISDADDTSDRARGYRGVLGALPDPAARFAWPKRDDRSQLVVEGRVVDVQPGASMSWDEDANERRTIHPFGADEADLSTIHMQFEVSQVLAANNGLDWKDAETIQLGLSVPASVDVSAARQELSDLGTMVLFLSRSPVFVYDDGAPEMGLDPSVGVWAILESGAFLGTVAEGGEVEFPAMSAGARDELVPDDGVTVDELIEAAEE